MAAVNIGSEALSERIRGGKPVLVDFWAPWCSYCRRISAAYDKIAEEIGKDVEVVKINIDEEPALAESEHIEVIPTLVLYRDGKAAGSIVAPESKAAIDGFLRLTLER